MSPDFYIVNRGVVEELKAHRFLILFTVPNPRDYDDPLIRSVKP